MPRMNLPKSEKLTYKKGNPIEFYLKNEVFETEKNISFVEKPNPKKVINLPNVPGEIARSSEYKSYYQIIREKIRRLAYRNYKKLYEGEVFLTFAIDPNGGLLASEVKKDKSTPNSYLCDIATQSVQEASPYPAFPDKLKNNKRLTFNVIISFEIK